MPWIIFNDPRALAPFASMAEGMQEVQEDGTDAEDVARAAALQRIVAAVGATGADAPGGPVRVPLAEGDDEEAQNVIENVLDNCAGEDEDDPDFYEAGFCEGDVRIEH